MANLTQDEREVLINSLAINCGSCDSDRPFLEGLSDETLVTFAENALPPQYKKKTESEAPDDEETEDDELQEDGEEEDMPPARKKKAPAGVGGATQNSQNEEDNTVAQKQQTPEEWFAAAPPAVQSAVRNAMAIEAREKNALVERLTANVSDQERKKTLTANLLGKELSELHDLASLVPAAPAQQSVTPLFFGASTPVGNASADEGFDKNDILPLPTINYAEISNSRTA